MAIEKIKIIFIEKDKEIEVETWVGLSILEVTRNNDIGLEGICEGSLTCTACHVVLEEKIYNMLKEPEDAEEDMLDTALSLTPTSRLGCQVILTKEMNGMRVKLPIATREICHKLCESCKTL